MDLARLVLDARPVVPLPGEWRFWAESIVGHVPLGPVEVSGFGYTSRLSGFGNGTATFGMPCGLDPARMLRLWSWVLWCYYEDALVWAGVPSGIADEDAAVRVSLTFTELPGYLTKRQFDQFPKWEPRQMEQTALAAQLAAPLADIGVRVVTSPGPIPVLRDRTYEYLENDRAQLLVNLSQVEQGPEFRAEYGTTAQGLPECVLRIATPRVGSGEAGLGVTIPGAALGYRAQWDADQLRTRTFAVGDLPEDEQDRPRPVAVWDRGDELPDLPRLDAVDDWPGTVLPSTLRERARTMSLAQSAPALQLSASPPAAAPSLARYAVGDDVTIRATTPLVPGGLEITGRLTELSVSAAAGTATWTVANTLPAPVARETVSHQLDRLDTWARQGFHAGPMNLIPTEETP
jgi:hypothetical protein